MEQLEAEAQVATALVAPESLEKSFQALEGNSGVEEDLQALKQGAWGMHILAGRCIAVCLYTALVAPGGGLRRRGGPTSASKRTARTFGWEA